MRISRKQIILFGIIFFTAISCTYHSEETLFTNIEFCDTANISYYSDIEPILQQHCWECHSALEAPNKTGINFEDSATLRGLAGSGILVNSLNQNPGSIFMPPDRPKLDSCSIEKIKIWIDNGFELE